MLWIMVMKIDYTNQNLAGNYKTEKLDIQSDGNTKVSSNEINSIEKENNETFLEKKKNKESMIEKVSKSVVGISKIKQNL